MIKNLIIIIIAINYIGLFSQQPSAPEQKKQTNTQPIELPNFIIEGKEKINVPSGIKQYPDSPAPLSKSELDSINSLEKQQSLLLPPKAFPDKIIDFTQKQGYLSGEFGRYSTPKILAAYGFRTSDYYLFGEGGLELSEGHLDNSGYSKLNLDLLSEYTAPEKYWIFGGSLTRTGLSIDNKKYSLYAQTKPEDRTKTNFDVFIDSDGNYEGYHFNTGAGFKTVQLSGNNSSAFDNAISAYLSVFNNSNEFSLGGSAMLDIHSIRGNGVNMFQGNVNGIYRKDDITLDLTGGFQEATSSGNVSRGGLYLDAKFNYRINMNFTFKAGVNSGLERNSYFDLINFNPYLLDTAIVDFPYNIALIKGYIFYHPNEKIALSAGIKFRITDRFPVYIGSDTGLFNIDYEDIKKADIELEGSYKITSKDILTGNLTFIYSALSKNDNSVPFISPFNTSLVYDRKWEENFGTKFGVTYVGERFADIYNKDKISGFLNFNAEIYYNINNDLTAFVRIENLFNSDVIIWKGYKERSLFVAAGLFWKF
jgi:hypothetical protein